MATTTKWTKAKVAIAEKILARYDNVRAAIPEIARAVGFPCTPTAIRCALYHNGRPTATSMLKNVPLEDSGIAAKFARLVELVKKPISLTELCNRLDMAPSRVGELVLQARADGIKVHIENDHVGIKFAEPLERVQAVPTTIAPTVGQRQQVGVISDTHLGSKYCLRDQLKDFIHHAYDRGVRDMLHSGDMLDGDYRHGKFEMTHMGVLDQTRDLHETLPELPGLRYHAITGNHDHTFAAESGVDTGEFIEGYFQKRGRKDFKCYGNRGAYLKIRGAVVHLWHPRSGGSYAVSYGLQKKIEGYSAIKPQVLIAGHWHRFCRIEERGIQAFAAPCFQAGQSEFSKSLTSSPAIGGLILSWTVTKDGTLRDFADEKRGYFEVERPVDVMNRLDGKALEVEIQEVSVRKRRAS